MLLHGLGLLLNFWFSSWEGNSQTQAIFFIHPRFSGRYPTFLLIPVGWL